MANIKLTNFEESKTSSVFIFADANVQGLSQNVNSMFLNEGYKLEKGSIEDGIYGIGSTTMRILFGAFVKRFTFQIKVTDFEEKVRIELYKAMTGISGGAIGYAKMNKEFKRISAIIKQFH